MDMILLNIICTIMFGVGVAAFMNYTFPGDPYLNGYVTGAALMLYYSVFLRASEKEPTT